MLLVVGAFCAFMLLLGISEPIFYVRYFLVVLPVLFVELGIATAAAFPLTRTWLVILPLAFFSRAAVTQFRAVDAIQRQNRGVRVRAGRHVVHPEVDEFPRVLGADTTARSIRRSGDGIIDWGSRGMSGAWRPRLLAKPAAADVRS